MRPITASRTETFAIGELSRLTGVNIETIRYYERDQDAARAAAHRKRASRL